MRANTSTYSAETLAEMIVERLDANTIAAARQQYLGSGGIQAFQVDELLPPKVAEAIYRSFPRPEQMRERKTLREHKYVAAQMDRYDPQAEAALFAFHDERVIAKVAQITEMAGLHPDAKLYAGGISLMTKGNFLNPHLDNSHNNDRTLYRALNLLYYVSPDWKLDSGGHLELWPDGVRGEPLVFPSLFNRLVVMATGPGSWHSVSRIKQDSRRCCVSNYYFSQQPVGGQPYFRVTTFRGRPEQPLRDLVLRVDGKLRQAVRRLRPGGLVQTSHIYQRTENADK